MALKQISMSDLYEKGPLTAATELVLDVRTPGEYAAGHVKGSTNIPLDQLEANLDGLRKYARIYIHCRSGKRATAAAQLLLQAKFENLVCVSGSGMDDWIAAGYPVEKGTDGN